MPAGKIPAAQCSGGPQKPGLQPSSVADYLRWREEAVRSQLRELRRRRPWVLSRLLIGALMTGLFTPCITMPPPGDGSGYCDHLQALYPWVLLLACVGLGLLLYGLAEAAGYCLVTPQLLRRRQATIRLTEMVQKGYGTIPQLDELLKMDRDEPVLMLVLTDLGVTPYAEKRSEEVV